MIYPRHDRLVDLLGVFEFGQIHETLQLASASNRSVYVDDIAEVSKHASNVAGECFRKRANVTTEKSALTLKTFALTFAQKCGRLNALRDLN